jgi:hypothetical protein
VKLGIKNRILNALLRSTRISKWHRIFELLIRDAFDNSYDNLRMKRPSPHLRGSVLNQLPLLLLFFPRLSPTLPTFRRSPPYPYISCHCSNLQRGIVKLMEKETSKPMVGGSQKYGLVWLREVMRDIRAWVSWVEDIKREPSEKNKELMRMLEPLMRVVKPMI